MPIHTITCYIQANKLRTTHNIIQNLLWIVQNIQAKDTYAAIIVMGDFNFHLSKITCFFNTIGLKGSVKPGSATHNLGNQLDEIFTN